MDVKVLKVLLLCSGRSCQKRPTVVGREPPIQDSAHLEGVEGADFL